jgi:hypothetical protein
MLNTENIKAEKNLLTNSKREKKSDISEQNFKELYPWHCLFLIK